MHLLKKLFNSQSKSVAGKSSQVICNYRDNYYGDQVCTGKLPG